MRIGALTTFPLISILLTTLSQATSITCDTEDFDTPIAFQDGDYLVAGIFNVGAVKERQEISATGSVVNVEYCDVEDARVYGLQKALMFREVVERYSDKFE